MVTRVAGEFAGTQSLLQVWAEAVVTPEITDLVEGVFARVREALTHYLTAWAAQNPQPTRADPPRGRRRSHPSCSASARATSCSRP